MHMVYNIYDSCFSCFNDNLIFCAMYNMCKDTKNVVKHRENVSKRAINKYSRFNEAIRSGATNYQKKNSLNTHQMYVNWLVSVSVPSWPNDLKWCAKMCIKVYSTASTMNRIIIPTKANTPLVSTRTCCKSLLHFNHSYHADINIIFGAWRYTRFNSNYIQPELYLNLHNLNIF